jgi:hypothetical protein
MANRDARVLMAGTRHPGAPLLTTITLAGRAATRTLRNKRHSCEGRAIRRERLMARCAPQT